MKADMKFQSCRYEEAKQYLCERILKEEPDKDWAEAIAEAHRVSILHSFISLVFYCL